MKTKCIKLFITGSSTASAHFIIDYDYIRSYHHHYHHHYHDTELNKQRGGGDGAGGVCPGDHGGIVYSRGSIDYNWITD